MRPVDEGGHIGVAPFWRGVFGGRVLSKNSGERGTPNRTRFFLEADKTAVSPEKRNRAMERCIEEQRNKTSMIKIKK